MNDELLEIRQQIVKLEECMKTEKHSYMRVISALGEKIVMLEDILREHGIDFE